jgi:hypothetical protein
LLGSDDFSGSVRKRKQTIFWFRPYHNLSPLLHQHVTIVTPNMSLLLHQHVSIVTPMYIHCYTIIYPFLPQYISIAIPVYTVYPLLPQHISIAILVYIHCYTNMSPLLPQYISIAIPIYMYIHCYSNMFPLLPQNVSTDISTPGGSLPIFWYTETYRWNGYLFECSQIYHWDAIFINLFYQCQWV